MRRRTKITHFAAAIGMTLVFTTGVTFVSPVFLYATDTSVNPIIEVNNQEFENQEFENQKTENQDVNNQEVDNHLFDYQEFDNQLYEIQAEEDSEEEMLGEPVVIDNMLIPENINYNSYRTTRQVYHAEVTSNYLHANPDGTFLKFNSTGSDIRIERLSPDFKVTKVMNTAYELPKFGGFYTDDKYIYIVTGSSNRYDESGIEPMRLTKYDMNLNKMGHVTLPTDNTYIPFAFGPARMDSVGDILYIRTNHQLPMDTWGKGNGMLYIRFDNVTFKVNTSKMTLTNSRTQVPAGVPGDGYVGEPLNNFIKTDNSGDVYALDQGGYTPRALMLYKLNPEFAEAPKTTDQDTVLQSVKIRDYSEDGVIGGFYYATSGQIGGLELTDNYIITTGIALPLNASSGITNAYYTVTPKNNFTAESTQYKYLTDCKETTSFPSIGNPMLVRINDSKVMVLWDENTNRKEYCVKYVILSESGNNILASETYTIDNAHLSNVNPVYDKAGNRVVWYWGDLKQLVFHSINLSTNVATTTVAASKSGNNPSPTPTPVTPTPTKGFTPSQTPVKPVVSGLPFTDIVEGKWYISPVKYVYDNGIMKGTGNGSTFEPNSPCTREMMVQILYSSAGSPVDYGDNPFTDVYAGKWYEKPVRWAYKYGVTSGKTPTTFGIGESVTREQVAMFLMNYAKQKGIDVSGRADLSRYYDSPQISGWAKDAVSWANNCGIINGKSSTSLDPKGNASRAEMAQMIMSFRQKVMNIY